MPTWALEVWIDETLKRAAAEMGVPDESTDFKKVCATPYEKKKEFADPE